MCYLLNGYYVAFSKGSFTANTIECPSVDNVSDYQEKYGDEWFIKWYDGNLYALPIVPEPKENFGKTTELKCLKHVGMKMLSARLQDQLGEYFPQKEIIRRKPYSFLSSQQEIVESTLRKLGYPNDMLTGFKITAKLEIESKIIEIFQKRLELGLFFKIRLEYDINTDLNTFLEQGVDLSGLYVVRRKKEDDQRSYVGRIHRIKDNVITLSESEIDEINIKEVKLEASITNYSHCLKHLLREDYNKFIENKFIEEGLVLTGSGYNKILNDFHKYLEKKGSVEITPGLTCSINSLISLERQNSDILKQLDPVQYCYDSSRTQTNPFAWEGLTENGPYSRETIRTRNPKFLIVFPGYMQNKSEGSWTKNFYFRVYKECHV